MIDRARTSWRGFFYFAAAAGALWLGGIAHARQEVAANGGAQIEEAPAPQAPPADDAAKQQNLIAGSALNQLPATESKSLGPRAALVTKKDAEAGEPGTSSSSLEKLKQNEIVRVGGALVFVLGLIFAARGLVRRTCGTIGGSGGGRPSGVVEILARYPMGARGQSLILLKVGRRIVLLHQSGTSMAALSEMHDPDEVAGLLSRMEAGSDSRSASKFRSTLEQFMSESHLPNKAGIGGASRRTVLPRGEAEIIDLTRRSGGLFSMFGWKRGGG